MSVLIAQEGLIFVTFY